MAATPTATTAPPPAVPLATQYRADSLLALPPARLTPADIAWLESYRTRANQSAPSPDVAQQVGVALGVVLIVGALGTVLALATLDGSN